MSHCYKLVAVLLISWLQSQPLIGARVHTTLCRLTDSRCRVDSPIHRGVSARSSYRQIKSLDGVRRLHKYMYRGCCRRQLDRFCL